MSASPKPLLCFLHIEKSAGMTFHRILQANFPSYVALAPYFWPGEERDVFTAREAAIFLRLLPFTAAMGGHCVRSYLGYADALGRPVRYITFLRDPVARYLSHYNHHRRRGWSHSFRDFSREPRFTNLMTKKVCGRYDVEEAKRALSEDFAFVGLVERFDESLHLLRNELPDLDLQIGYEKENTSTDPGYRASEELSEPWVADAAAEANRLDFELYDFATRTLWPRYVARYRGSLEADLGESRPEGAGFARPALWFEGLRAYRLLGYRPFEMALRGYYHPELDDSASRIVDVSAWISRALRRTGFASRKT